jgi:hypothetical protein
MIWNSFIEHVFGYITFDNNELIKANFAISKRSEWIQNGLHNIDHVSCVDIEVFQLNFFKFDT